MKQLSHLLIALLATFFLSACEGTPERAVKVGMCQWPGYEPLFLAAQLNMFDRPVKILRFSSPGKAYQAFKSGAIDVVGLTADELLKYADYGSVPKIFLIMDISNGADALVAKPSVKELKEIKGKRVALESSVLAQYMLHRSLDKAGVSLEEIEIKNIEIVDQPQAYKDDKADVFVTFEPSLNMMIQEGGHVIFDTSMIPNEIVDALAASENIWKKDQKTIAALKKGWFKALDYINQHPDRAYEIMGKLEGISAQEFKESLSGLSLGTKEINDEMIKRKQLLPPLQKLQKIMLEKKIVQKEIDPLLFIGE